MDGFSQLCRHSLGHMKYASEGEFACLIDFLFNEDTLNFNKMVFEMNSKVERPLSIFKASEE